MNNNSISNRLVARGLMSLACISSFSQPIGVFALPNQGIEHSKHLDVTENSNTSSDTYSPPIGTAAGIYYEKRFLDNFNETFWITTNNYVGECPGTEITSNKIRFLSKKMAPAKNLRVEISSGTPPSAKTYKYTKQNKGSETFRVSKLANFIPNSSTDLIAGKPQSKKTAYYTIFNKDSNEILERGKFSFTVRNYTQVFRRNMQLAPIYNHVEYVDKNGKKHKKRVIVDYQLKC